MNNSILGLYYEDFEVGGEIKHSLSKTIFESDNNFFSLLTMNHHPRSGVERLFRDTA